MTKKTRAANGEYINAKKDTHHIVVGAIVYVNWNGKRGLVRPKNSDANYRFRTHCLDFSRCLHGNARLFRSHTNQTSHILKLIYTHHIHHKTLTIIYTTPASEVVVRLL